MRRCLFSLFFVMVSLFISLFVSLRLGISLSIDWFGAWYYWIGTFTMNLSRMDMFLSLLVFSCFAYLPNKWHIP